MGALPAAGNAAYVFFLFTLLARGCIFVIKTGPSERSGQTRPSSTMLRAVTAEAGIFSRSIPFIPSPAPPPPTHTHTYERA